MATEHMFTDTFFGKIPESIMSKYKGFNLRYLTGIVNLQPGSKALRSRTIPYSTNGIMTFKGLSNKLLETCRSGVNYEYIGVAMLKSLHTAFSSKNHSQHEILLMTKKSGDKPQYGEISVNNIQTEDIVGFIIIQVGECRLYPSIPALKIICTNDGPHSSKASNFLMYIYLRAMIENKHEYGLLEVAGSYRNPGALCLYNKFGFREDALLDDSTCFGEEGTLSMRADLNDKAYKNLDDVILNNLPINIREPEPMCKKGSIIGPNGTGQQEYINIRARNRIYLDNFFKSQDIDTTEDLLKSLDIDIDVLDGDGKSHNGVLYAKKELIEKGKSLALNNQETIKQFFDESQRSKMGKSPSSDSQAPSVDSSVDSSVASVDSSVDSRTKNDKGLASKRNIKNINVKRKGKPPSSDSDDSYAYYSDPSDLHANKKHIKHKRKTAKNLNVKRKRKSSNKTSNGNIRILRKTPRRMSVRIKRQKNLTLKSTKSI